MTREKHDRNIQWERNKPTKDILKSKMKKKREKNRADDLSNESSSGDERRTPFRDQYEYKTSMDKRFEDEVIWDDPAAKITALELFVRYSIGLSLECVRVWAA